MLYKFFLPQNMRISSHCTIGKHAYGTCLNGYAYVFQQSVFVCDKCSNLRQFEKQIIRNVIYTL